MGPRDPGTLGPWDLGTLGPWDPGTLGSWDHGTLGPWDPGTMGPWDPGTLGPWDPRTLGPWDPGTMETWDPGTLGPWDRHRPTWHEAVHAQPNRKEEQQQLTSGSCVGLALPSPVDPSLVDPQSGGYPVQWIPSPVARQAWRTGLRLPSYKLTQLLVLVPSENKEGLSKL